MSMFNDIDSTRRGIAEQCFFSNSEQVLDLEAKRNGLENQITFLKENGKTEPTFEGSGHPVFKGVSPLARGILRNKNNKETIHFNADASNTEL